MRVGIMHPVPGPLASANWFVSASSWAGIIAAVAFPRRPVAPGPAGGVSDV